MILFLRFAVFGGGEACGLLEEAAEEGEGGEAELLGDAENGLVCTP